MARHLRPQHTPLFDSIVTGNVGNNCDIAVWTEDNCAARHNKEGRCGDGTGRGPANGKDVADERGNGGAMGRNDPNNEPSEMTWNGHLDCICCGSRGSWLMGCGGRRRSSSSSTDARGENVPKYRVDTCENLYKFVNSRFGKTNPTLLLNYRLISVGNCLEV